MIDQTRLDELRAEIGSEDLAEVIEMFCEEVEDALSKLDGTSFENAVEHLHFLKGSALNLGFEAFSTLCASGEVAAASGDHDEIDLAEVITTYDQSKATFLADLKDRLAA